MNNHTKIIILILIIIILTGFILYTISSVRKDNTLSLKQRIDTLFIESPRQDIHIDKIPAKIINSIDTIKNQPRLIAIADTISLNDTISLSYSFPDNNFSIRIRRPPDSTMVQRIFTENQVYITEPWWENPVYFIVGFLIGLVVGLVS